MGVPPTSSHLLQHPNALGLPRLHEGIPLFPDTPLSWSLVWLSNQQIKACPQQALSPEMS